MVTTYGLTDSQTHFRMGNNTGRKCYDDRARGEQHVSRDSQPIVPPSLLHDQPARQASGYASQYRGEERNAGRARALTADRLRVQCDMVEHGKGRAEAEEIREVAREQRPVGHNPLRRERLGGPQQFDGGERAEEESEGAESGKSERRSPARVPTRIEPEEEEEDHEDEGERASKIDSCELAFEARWGY